MSTQIQADINLNHDAGVISSETKPSIRNFGLGSTALPPPRLNFQFRRATFRGGLFLSP